MALALIAPKPRHAHCRAQFPRLCLLLAHDRERTLKIGLRFRGVRTGDISAISPAVRWTSASNHLSFVCSHRRHRFANAAPGAQPDGKLRVTSYLGTMPLVIMSNQV
jgi:hypothetical protein